jgi:hypothetical protein
MSVVQLSLCCHVTVNSDRRVIESVLKFTELFHSLFASSYVYNGECTCSFIPERHYLDIRAQLQAVTTLSPGMESAVTLGELTGWILATVANGEAPGSTFNNILETNFINFKHGA